MGLVRRKPKIDRKQALSAKPVRLVEGDLIEGENGARLKVPLRATRWSGWSTKPLTSSRTAQPCSYRRSAIPAALRLCESTSPLLQNLLASDGLTTPSARPHPSGEES